MPAETSAAMDRNIRLYPWYRFLFNLLFWQSIWFLYFQSELSAAEAILLYVIYDLTVTVLEVPSGYASDRIGRRRTLVLAAGCTLLGVFCLTLGGGFAVLAAGQMLLGAGMAFNSGTDTALLFQSLAATGRQSEMERQSVRAWRFTFSALAVSALAGGGMALVHLTVPFAVTAVALAAALWVTLRFTEPPTDGDPPGTELERLRHLLGAFRQPVLTWLFCIGMLMYGYSHIPFVFGQPFIDAALAATALAGQTPMVSGVVTALMMAVSLAVSLLAPRLREQVGLMPMLLFAFALQIALAGGLALSGSAFAIALLLMRMVPDSLSTPFIEAHLQPRLQDDSRATFLSVKSLFGRLIFAGSLAIAAGSTTRVGEMPLDDLQSILGWYAVIGLALLGGLALAALALRRQS